MTSFRNRLVGFIVSVFFVPSIAAESNGEMTNTNIIATAANAGLIVPSKSNRAFGDVAAKDILLSLSRQHAKQQGQQAINLSLNSTAASLDALINQKIDLAAIARSADPRIIAEQGLDFTPMVFDGLAVIVHPKNPLRNINIVQLRALYKGQIKNWKELGGADKPIGLVANITPRDGVEFSFRQALFGNGNQPIAAGRYYLSLEQVEQGVMIDIHGIGLSTFSRVQKSAGKLRSLSIEGIIPDLSSLSDGRYLLPSPMYLVSRAGDASATLQTILPLLQSTEFASSAERQFLLPRARADIILRDEMARKKRIADLINPPAPIVVLPTPKIEIKKPIKKPRKAST